MGFLQNVCNEAGLNDTVCVHARAEEAANEEEYRGVFDVAVSRAVARLNVLCELCLPYVKEGGIFVAMKSIDSNDEITEASRAMSVLGASLLKVYDYEIPETGIFHRAVVIKKTGETPKGYPRRNAKIQKSPL